MKAVGFKTSLPLTHPDSFIDFDTDIPQPTGHQILVKIEAIAVNPIDYKIRQNSAKEIILTEPKIIGWDAVGKIVAIGEKVNLFKIGDEVFYAGSLTEKGCNAEYQLVDERIVGFKPKNISNSAAAAMPLTSLTAWEILFDRLKINPETDKGKSILIIGAAGGVGSIAIQIAKKVAQLNVIATASRPATKEWCIKQGADLVLNHYNLIEEAHNNNIKDFDYIIDLANLNQHWDAMVELIKPQGHIASITGSDTPIQLNKLKTKSISFSFEYMFTRPMYQTEDLYKQHQILNTIADLLDQNILTTTLFRKIKGLNAENLKKAHQLLEEGNSIGKIVIEL